MTAKEKWRHVVEELSEAEARDALGFIAQRRSGRDAPSDLLGSAPVDDEPTTPDEDDGAREGREELARGEVFTAAAIKREIGCAHATTTCPTFNPTPVRLAASRSRPRPVALVAANPAPNKLDLQARTGLSVRVNQ